MKGREGREVEVVEAVKPLSVECVLHADDDADIVSRSPESLDKGRISQSALTATHHRAALRKSCSGPC